MKLFATLYLDEDVHVLVAVLLRKEGFDVTTALQEGMLGKSDQEQLAYAVATGRCLLTHNRADFMHLYEQYLVADEAHFGILIAIRRTAHELAERVAARLNLLTADEMEGQLLFV
jgi:predicted nuclease of predicted toxin-antitoxin system